MLCYPRAQQRFKKVGRSESSEARIEGAKRTRFEGEAWIEGEAQERAERGLDEPLRWKILKILSFKSFNLVYRWKGNLEKIDFSKKT